MKVTITDQNLIRTLAAMAVVGAAGTPVNARPAGKSADGIATGDHAFAAGDTHHSIERNAKKIEESINGIEFLDLKRQLCATLKHRNVEINTEGLSRKEISNANRFLDGMIDLCNKKPEGETLSRKSRHLGGNQSDHYVSRDTYGHNPKGSKHKIRL